MGDLVEDDPDDPNVGARADPRRLIEGFIGLDMETLLEAGMRRAYRVANRNLHEAEDIVQDTFVKLQEAALRGVSGPSEEPLAYFKRAVSNAAAEYFKAKHAEKRGGKDGPLRLDDNVTAISTAPQPLTFAENAALRQCVAQAIAVLPNDQRAVVMLALDPVRLDFHAMSQLEIADKLGIEVHQVKSRLFEAKKKLARHLRDSLGGEEYESA